MATISIGDDSARDASRQQLHHLPCRLNHDGSAQVESYFTPLIRTGPSQYLSSTLHGRPLDGVIVSLCDGYSGVVVSQGKAGEYRAVGRFDEYTSWNWDRKPDPGSDPALCLSDWLQVADVIHGE